MNKNNISVKSVRSAVSVTADSTDSRLFSVSQHTDSRKARCAFGTSSTHSVIYFAHKTAPAVNDRVLQS